jgi:hypothetical protein
MRCLLLIIVLAGLCAGAWSQTPRPRGASIWLETEAFQDCGGWTLETQFIERMGSAYLLAQSQNLDGPVADAKTQVKVPQAGHYRVFVRCRNWDTEFTPGRFQIAVAGQALPTELGVRPEGKWLWEKAGEVDLPAGETTVALHDLTGEYGRCDCILLTTDLAFNPPDDQAATAALRAELSGVSQTPRDMGRYDFIVVGGGVGGTIAAIAAARHGCRVALIQNRPVLGGNASQEVLVGVAGASAGGGNANARESGLVEELYRDARRLKTWEAALKAACDAERSLRLFLNTEATGVVLKDKATIEGVKAVNTVTGERYVFHGALFADCTGDADLGAAAGAEFRMGREPRSMYNEPIAPVEGDKVTLPTSLLYLTKDMPTPQPFHAPKWAHHFEKETLLPHRIPDSFGPFWWIELGGTQNTITDEEEIRDELLRATYGMWDFIKNRSDLAAKATNRRFSWVAHVTGKRESRRLIGDYVLIEKDVRQATKFADAVAYGGWPIDIHADKGIYDTAPLNISIHVDPYNIPFRCLYSRNISNLMMAGRDISVSHVALGTTRVMGTIGTEGQAIGTAAALCKQYKTSPRGVYEAHIAELQRMLVRDDAYIIGLRNDDPRDLARTAKISASSTARSELFVRERMSHTGKSHPMSSCRAQMFLATMDRLEKAEAWIASHAAAPVELTAHLCKAAGPRDFTAVKQVATAKATMPVKSEAWLAFEFNAPVEKGSYYYVWIERKTEDVFWRLTSDAPHSFPRAYSGDGVQWNPVSEQYALATTPPVEIAEAFAPGNVINGLTRRLGMDSNMWASDPLQPLPQWLELDLRQPTVISEVQLTFDTDLHPPYPGNYATAQTVRDYEVQVRVGGEWRTVAKVTDNYQRLRRHRFEPVTADAAKLIVTATNGDKSAKVFEVRAY